MSGFEHYTDELTAMDHEIRHYAAICGVDLGNRQAIDACIREHHDNWADDKARENLRGLLVLRIKVEAEMLELGFTPPPLLPQLLPE